MQEIWDKKHREELILWRQQAYYQAAHFFDSKKPTPTIAEWFPFDWEEIQPKSTYFSFRERIEMFKKAKWEHKIPPDWYKLAEDEPT